MTDLQEGSRYLLSESKNNKSVIFVKLTDSAIQSIERFFNSKDGSLSKPTIQFQDNSGLISFPQNGRSYSYGFTLTEFEGSKTQTKVQCLEHADDNSLTSLGFMDMKMQIHATEDSYEKTKCKMAAADQEQKNLCTKELQQTSRRPRIGNKVSIKRPGLTCIPEKTPGVLKSEPVNSKSKVASPGSLIKQPIRQRIIQILAAKSYKKAEITLRLKREGVSDKDKEQINDILCQVGKLKGNIFTLENHMWNEVKEDWEFSSEEELQLIKKRKQQFLKTNVNGFSDQSKFVKQDLLSSMLDKKTYMNGLTRNGNLKASKALSTIANNISSLQTSFVKQQDKNEEKNEKFCGLFHNTTLLQASNADHQAPTNGLPNGKLPSLQSSFVPQEHRNGDINGESSVMHMEVDTNGNDANSRDRLCNGTSSNEVSMNKTTEKKSRAKRTSSKISEGPLLDKIQLFKEKFLKNCSPALPPSHKKITMNGNINNSSNTLVSCSSESASIASPQSIIDIDEIKSKYPKVESWEQASQYVKEFNDNYDEYLKMHCIVKETFDRFSVLFDQLDASIDGSPQNKKIRLQIVREYDIALKNSYKESRRKFEFLKAKLAHLQKLVMDYSENL